MPDDPAEHAKYATRKAGQLLSWYRRSDDWSSDEFLTGIAANLARYPKDVIDEVCHPSEGIASRNKFPPNPSEVRDACEAIMIPRRKKALKDAEIQAQLEDRKRLETPRVHNQTIDEIKAELLARGFSWGGRSHKVPPTPAAERERLINSIAVTQKISIADATVVLDAMDDGPKTPWMKINEAVG